MMAFFKNPLIVALDVDTMKEAEALVEQLSAYSGGFKVGMQLYNSVGPETVRQLCEKNVPVFVDLKLHDIPNTVAGAARVLTRHGASILNVHAAGGKEMMRAAVEAAHGEAGKRTRIVNDPLQVPPDRLRKRLDRDAPSARPRTDRPSHVEELDRRDDPKGLLAEQEGHDRHAERGRESLQFDQPHCFEGLRVIGLEVEDLRRGQADTLAQRIERQAEALARVADARGDRRERRTGFRTVVSEGHLGHIAFYEE